MTQADVVKVPMLALYSQDIYIYVYIYAYCIILSYTPKFLGWYETIIGSLHFLKHVLKLIIHGEKFSTTTPQALRQRAPSIGLQVEALSMGQGLVAAGAHTWIEAEEQRAAAAWDISHVWIAKEGVSNPKEFLIVIHSGSIIGFFKRIKIRSNTKLHDLSLLPSKFRENLNLKTNPTGPKLNGLQVWMAKSTIPTIFRMITPTLLLINQLIVGLLLISPSTTYIMSLSFASDIHHVCLWNPPCLVLWKPNLVLQRHRPGSGRRTRSIHRAARTAAPACSICGGEGCSLVPHGNFKDVNGSSMGIQWGFNGI